MAEILIFEGAAQLNWRIIDISDDDKERTVTLFNGAS